LSAELEALNEKAAYQMRQFEKSKEHSESCLKYTKENTKDVEAELIKSKERIKESITGIYDFASIVEQHLKRENLNFDVADYKSDKISIEDTDKKKSQCVTGN